MRSANICAIADSGTQACLMGLQPLKKLGLRRQHLTRVNKRTLVANNEEINVLGALFLKLSGLKVKGQQLMTSAMVYVTDSTDRFYLSRAALAKLGIIGYDFPKIGATREAEVCQNNAGTHDCPKLAEWGCPLPTAHCTTPSLNQPTYYIFTWIHREHENLAPEAIHIINLQNVPTSATSHNDRPTNGD